MHKKLTLVLIFACTLGLLAISVSDLTTALDSPSGITFSNPKGTISKESKFSDDHIGNWDTGKKSAIYPIMGSNFLKMGGSSNSSNTARANRIASSFSFTVKGAGMLSFFHRVATYSMNDDLLVFYEDDINTPLLELGGEYWYKKENFDGDVYFGLYDEDFWVEDSLNIIPDRYTHTVNVALIKPYKGEDYWAPESTEVVKNCAWLDCFVWEPQTDVMVCDFDPIGTTEFGSAGLTVYLDSDYVNDDDFVLEYWYTIDGSTPRQNSSNSKRYNAHTGISLPGELPVGAVMVKVAAYDGTTQIGEYSETYTRRISVGVPFVNEASQALLEPGIILTLGCESVNGASLVYYYTLDGSDPTIASAQATGNAIPVISPCTVKVIASDGTEQSTEPLVVKVTQASKPTYTIKVDGGSSDNLVFAGKCVVTAKSSDGSGVNYCANNGAPKVYSAPLTFTETTTLQLVAAGTVDVENAIYQLNSSRVLVTTTKEESNDGAWATDQVKKFTADAWNLFAVTRQLSAPRASEIIAWLHPFAYNDATRTLEQATTLQGGASYLVHSSMIEDKNKPSDFADGGVASPITGDGTRWVLSAEGAQVIWDGKSWVMVPTDSTDLPGWRQ